MTGVSPAMPGVRVVSVCNRIYDDGLEQTKETELLSEDGAPLWEEICRLAVPSLMMRYLIARIPGQDCCVLLFRIRRVLSTLEAIAGKARHEIYRHTRGPRSGLSAF